MNPVRMVEGVPWRNYVVRFTTAEGKRKQWSHWSPGPPWLYGEIRRYLDERVDVLAGSDVTIEERAR